MSVKTKLEREGTILWNEAAKGIDMDSERLSHKIIKVKVDEEYKRLVQHSVTR